MTPWSPHHLVGHFLKETSNTYTQPATPLFCTQSEYKTGEANFIPIEDNQAKMDDVYMSRSWLLDWKKNWCFPEFRLTNTFCQRPRHLRSLAVFLKANAFGGLGFSDLTTTPTISLNLDKYPIVKNPQLRFSIIYRSIFFALAGLKYGSPALQHMLISMLGYSERLIARWAFDNTFGEGWCDDDMRVIKGMCRPWRKPCGVFTKAHMITACDAIFWRPRVDRCG